MAFLFGKNACGAYLLTCVHSESLGTKVLISLILRLFSSYWLYLSWSIGFTACDRVICNPSLHVEKSHKVSEIREYFVLLLINCGFSIPA